MTLKGVIFVFGIIKFHFHEKLLLRDGYRRRIGIATSIIAEFWALRDGLLLAAQLGITLLVVELDAKIIVQLLRASTAVELKI